MSDILPVTYALIWRARDNDETFQRSEFDERIPRLMVWLRDLRASGKLLACGGGGFETSPGGLTIVQAESPEEAQRIAAGSPMNEIGATEVFEWSVYYGKLDFPREF